MNGTAGPILLLHGGMGQELIARLARPAHVARFAARLEAAGHSITERLS